MSALFGGSPLWAQAVTPTPPAPPTSHKLPPRHVKSSGPSAGVADSELEQPDIIGGEIAEEGAWPWQAAILYPGEANPYLGQYCGGSLIAPQWVLTAAHCVDGLPSGPGLVDALLGQNVLSAAGGNRVTADLIIVHPDYSTLSLDSDLALLRLTEPVDQQPVALVPRDDEELTQADELATVIGWGQFIPDLSLASDVLRQVELPLVSQAECSAPDAWGELITDNMLCAGYAAGDRSVCYGDSGGPLMVPTDGAPGWTQVGIVSWGSVGCIGQKRYNVYTRVARFRGWIDSCLNDALSAACRGAGFVGDDFEPDGDFSLRHKLTVDGAGQSHNFHRPQDNDWFAFDAVAGGHYVIYTSQLERRADTIMWLYDVDGLSLLSFNDDRPSTGIINGDTRYDLAASAIVWTAPADGTYFVLVHPFQTEGYGNHTGYTMRVVEIKNDRFLPVLRMRAR